MLGRGSLSCRFIQFISKLKSANGSKTSWRILICTCWSIIVFVHQHRCMRKQPIPLWKNYHDWQFWHIVWKPECCGSLTYERESLPQKRFFLLVHRICLHFSTDQSLCSLANKGRLCHSYMSIMALSWDCKHSNNVASFSSFPAFIPNRLFECYAEINIFGQA